MASKQDEFTSPAADIPVLIKVDNHFIPQKHVRSVARFGKGCKIVLVSGEEILVKANYDKVADLVK